MQQLFESARRQGFTVSGVRIKDRNGDRFIYFIKNQDGKVLHGGNSFTREEVARLFPETEAPTNL